jgi:cytochrome c oxidase subunit II
VASVAIEQRMLGACRPSSLQRMLSAAGTLLSASGVAVASSAPSAGARDAPSIFTPASLPAELIRELSWLVLGITAGIFVVVTGLLVYCLVRFRQRPGDEQHEPPQVYGSNHVELAWTVVPLLIVVVLFLATTRSIIAVESAAPPPGSLKVTVVGYQWWWEFRYPELGIITANELHVPVSARDDRRATELTLLSGDVVHSFWVPQLAGKTDVIPNRTNHMWVEPFEAGTYVGQCAEFCGTQHAKMLLRVIVHDEGGFERWVAEQQRSPVVPEAPVARAGRDVFQQTACINCHTIGDTVATGTFGPDLSHLMSRATIGAGAAANTPDNLSAWVRDPQRLKPGCLMPAMQLDEEHVHQIVAYLQTLR